MKITEMLAREPFGQILERTLAGHWERISGKPCTVRWYPRRPRARRESPPGEQVLLCFPELNAILSPSAESAVRRRVRRMFANTPSRWRRPLLQAYVTAATQPVAMSLAARAGVGIVPPLHRAESILICPGNARVRIYDFARGCITVVLKDGFPADGMRRELVVRTANRDGPWPIPPVLAQGEDGSWFEEPLLDGEAVNRCPPGVDVVPPVEQAFAALGSWLDASRVEASAAGYVAGLEAQIRADLATVILLTEADRAQVEDWLERASALGYAHARRAGDSLCLAVGHGDFQPGNILVDEGQVWLVDWEHSSQRQQHYDVLVFGLRSRFSRGLAERVAALLAGRWAGDAYAGLWVPQLPADEERLQLVLLIFLLEELAWYLHENANPLFERLSGGWRQFRGEMDGALACLGAMESRPCV